MLHEDKIKLMTELSFYEKKEGKESATITQYFKKDYISKHMIQGFFCFTLSSFVVFLIHVLYSIDTIMSTVNPADIIHIFDGFVLYYVIGLFVFEGIIWLVYTKRYEQAQKVQRILRARLVHLKKRYESKQE